MNPSSCAFTNSVLGFNMKFILQPELRIKYDPEGKQDKSWISLQSMKCERANFALTAIDNLVYVFGGISSRGEGKNQHRPFIANTVCEKYDPKLDKWETHEIKAAPPLAAFSWTLIPPFDKNGDSSKMLIMGGTDGDLIQEDQYLVDFKAQKCDVYSNSIDQQLAMSKLIYREKENKVYCIGGYGSVGLNYVRSLDEGDEWQEFERKHSSILAQSNDLELPHNTFIYFE